MNYQVTQQYARDEERLIANFTALTEAKAYIAACLERDAQLRVTIVYRLFDRKHCLQEYNKAKAGALLHEALYADGTRFLPETIQHGYDVVSDAGAAASVAAFYHVNDARDFIVRGLMQAIAASRIVNYQLKQEKTLIEAMDSATFAAAQSGGEGGMKSSVAFAPTPLNTSPRPPGTPPSVMDIEEEG